MAYNLCVVLDKIYGKFSFSFTILVKNTFSEPQHDSAYEVGQNNNRENLIFITFFYERTKLFMIFKNLVEKYEI